MIFQYFCNIFVPISEWPHLTAKVISWRSATHMYFPAFSQQYLHNFSFQSHRLLFSHASAEVRDENTPERKLASTGDRTHNHQVMSPTRSPLNHPAGALEEQRPLVRFPGRPMFFPRLVIVIATGSIPV